LSKIINTLQSNNNQKEIYLTDTVSLLKNSLSLEIDDNGELQGLIIEYNYQNAKKLFRIQ